MELHDDVAVGETLPNHDGTFQKSVVLAVAAEDRKKGEYTCEVAHQSGPSFVEILVEDGKLISQEKICESFEMIKFS